ncbi:MAG: hypothetical protein QME51_11055 [Planctomycetota bacterium]|nr:hypothetical protein [Planctomycetota bacterium]
MRNKLLGSLFGVIIGISVVNGCSSPPPPPPYVIKTPETAKSPATEKTVVVDQRLLSAVDVLSENSERQPDGRLKIVLTFQNKTGGELHIRARTIFKDEKFNPVGDETNWEYIMIPQHATHSYLCTSYSNKASKYTIEVLLEK